MALKSETKDNSTLYTETVCLSSLSPSVYMCIYTKKTFKTTLSDNYPKFLPKMRKILLLLYLQVCENLVPKSYPLSPNFLQHNHQLDAFVTAIYCAIISITHWFQQRFHKIRFQHLSASYNMLQNSCCSVNYSV